MRVKNEELSINSESDLTLNTSKQKKGRIL